jgi:hypothetical protein
MERVSPRKKTLKVDNDENENNLSDFELSDSAKSSPVKTDDSKFKHDISDSEEEEVPEMKSSEIELKVRQVVSDSEEEEVPEMKSSEIESKVRQEVSDSEEDKVSELKSSDIESKVRQEVSDSEEESPVDAMEKKTYQPMNVEKQDGTSDGIKFLSL